MIPNPHPQVVALLERVIGGDTLLGPLVLLPSHIDKPVWQRGIEGEVKGFTQAKAIIMVAEMLKYIDGREVIAHRIITAPEPGMDNELLRLDVWGR